MGATQIIAMAARATLLLSLVALVIVSGENISNISSNNNNNNSDGANRSQRAEQLERQLLELRYRFETNRAINERPYYCLLAVYSLLMLVGAIFNSLILFTVVLRPSILSPRNIFVVNLAASDLLLCVFTMPFSFIEISMKTWQLGLLPCKLTASLQATSIFVSTISILAIALDRYKVIVYPTPQEAPSTRRCDMLILASVWAFAMGLSLPLFYLRTVRHMDLPQKYETSVKAVDFCIEEWPFNHGRGIYSVISMIFQYVVPISIVSVVYAKISKRLQKRLIRRQQQLTQSECKQKRQLNLIKRTHTMLVSVSLVFGLSWLPLNLLNVLSDFTDLFTGERGDEQQFRVVFAVCHLIGCMSACTNPILYAYMNDNFRKEALVAYGHHLNRLGRLLNLKSSTTAKNQNYRRSPEANVHGFGDTSKGLLRRPGQSEVSIQRSPGSNQAPSSMQPVKNPPKSSRLPSPSSTANNSTISNSTRSDSTTSSTCSTSGGSSQELGSPGACKDQLANQGRHQDASPSPSQQQWLTLATNLRPGGSHVVLNMERLLAAPGGQKSPSANGLEASEQRRCSFQTGSGGGHQLSSTMRLCFCISRGSSESQVVQADGEGQSAELSNAELMQQQGCSCQCHCNENVESASTRLRSSSQTSSLVAATANALASTKVAARVGELRWRASKLLAPSSVAKHSAEVGLNLAEPPRRQRRRRRPRDKRAHHRHQSHCSACRDSHHHHRHHRKQRRRENQHDGAQPALTLTSAKEAGRSASMAVLGADGESEPEEPTNTSATVPKPSDGGATVLRGGEQGINRATNNKAPGETMSFQAEVEAAMQRRPATNGDAINAGNLDEDCDCSHSSSLLASCHLYSHSSSCTCSCRSSFSCPFVQHLGRPPPLPLVAPSGFVNANALAATAATAAATTTTTTTPSPSQFRRRVSWQAAHAAGDEQPFMQRDTCGCSTSSRARKAQTSSCSSTTNSPVAIRDGGPQEQSIAQQLPLSDETRLVVECKRSMDELYSAPIHQSASSKFACPLMQPTDASSQDTTSRKDAANPSETV